MDKYQCDCGYQYDPGMGDPVFGIPPGVDFEDVPEDYECPICGGIKDSFKPVQL